MALNPLSGLGLEKTSEVKELSPEELEQLDNLGKLNYFIQQSDWPGAIGAAIALYTEYFGTPEEKAEQQEAKKELKEDQARQETRENLGVLKEDVEEIAEKEEKTPEPAAEKPEPPKRAPEKPTISPKAELEERVNAIYAERGRATYTVNNLYEHFGRDISRFIVREDPVTGKPIEFLGRPISGGINIMMLPYLKMAEEELRGIGITYQPRGEVVLGYQNRNMNLIGQGESKNIPSFHKFGLAIDIDPGVNGPKDGRGDIPDQVILAMARAGFTSGLFGNEDAPYLGQDPMHFQLEFPPQSETGQRIIGQSEIGRQYYVAIASSLSRENEAVA
jgi:hypothetical protein